MTKYAGLMCDLAVDDEIFVGLAPDAALYRGLWMMSFDAVAGFTVDVDLVSVAEEYANFQAGLGAVSTPVNPAPLAYDFTNGLGDATKDACQKAELWGGVHTDYRNNNALLFEPMAPAVFAGLGQSLYMRLTVTALGEFGGDSAEACCNTCGGDNYPTFQVGAIYDRLCADKQRVRNFCNCPEKLCGEDCE
jgi:hypothetical protein